MSTNNSTNQSCFESYDTKAFEGVVYLSAAIAVVSCVCILLMIGLIFLFKKHHFFTQRLILYLAFASLANSFVVIFNVFGYKVYRSPELLDWCIAVGCIYQVTSWLVILAMSCIMMDIFIKVVFNRSTEKCEVVYVLAVILSPVVLTAWIPFIQHGYGPSGPICWIRVRDLDNCDKFNFGIAMEFFLYYAPFYLLTIILVVLLFIALLLIHRQTKRWVGKYDHETQFLKRRMEKEIRPLVAYPIIFLLTNIFPLINRIYGVATQDVDKTDVVLWYLVSLYQLQGVLITLAFFLDRETRARLTWVEIRASFAGLYYGSNKVSEYPIIDEDGDRDSISRTEEEGYQNVTD